MLILHKICYNVFALFCFRYKGQADFETKVKTTCLLGFKFVTLAYRLTRYFCAYLGCGIEVTDKFEAYDGGIYSEVNDDPQMNHELSIVGWGYDEATG